jgi:hypothetical protein
VIPSHDYCVLAVHQRTGLTSLEDVAARRYPLKIGVRANPDHYLRILLEHTVAAAGFTLDDLRAWGGGVRSAESAPPRPGGAAFEALANGELDALFEEGIAGWLAPALDLGMTIVPFGDATLGRLEAMGYRRATVTRQMYPQLRNDVVTLDFSGWPVFVHAECSDELVAQMCAALDERKANIAWEGEGPLPVERMCRDGVGTPLDVPLHPAAERFWKTRGYV